jgi:hypothetical protein
VQPDAGVTQADPSALGTVGVGHTRTHVLVDVLSRNGNTQDLGETHVFELVSSNCGGVHVGYSGVTQELVTVSSNCPCGHTDVGVTQVLVAVSSNFGGVHKVVAVTQAGVQADVIVEPEASFTEVV